MQFNFVFARIQPKRRRLNVGIAVSRIVEQGSPCTANVKADIYGPSAGICICLNFEAREFSVNRGVLKASSALV